jgi:hypothetical protein
MATSSTSSSTIMAEKSHGKRGPTSMNIDRGLWFKVRKTALERGITTTKFVETALEEKLEKDRGSLKESDE